MRGGIDKISELGVTPMNKKTLYSCAAVIALLLWIVLFSAGLLMDSSPYRTRIVNGPFTMRDFTAAILLYTPSNVALLSVVSGFLGGCASKLAGPGDVVAKLELAQSKGDQRAARDLERRMMYLSESPATSMLRGFLVYIGVISGILLLISDPFKDPTAEQFIRTAGLVSAIAFVMGYDPTRFEEMIAKFLQWKPSGP